MPSPIITMVSGVHLDGSAQRWVTPPGFTGGLLVVVGAGVAGLGVAGFGVVGRGVTGCCTGRPRENDYDKHDKTIEHGF